MAIVYPDNIDSFGVPSLPENTSLSSAGTSTRAHTQNHQDLGLAIVALETHTAPLNHDHSTTDGDGTWPTNKLKQANTHEEADTDLSVVSLHHTLGQGAAQAAAGNHAHDYNGSSIFNKPLIICTSTTRPTAPYPGLQIWETDTNTHRVWAAFPGNTYDPPENAGVSYTYNFNTNNSATGLDSGVFAQTYVVGAPGPAPDGGFMAAPTAGDCRWVPGSSNDNCRCIARAIVANFATTVTDDVEISIVTGSSPMGANINYAEKKGASPTNDMYLRMSDDGQSYVRFAIGLGGAVITYTNSGEEGEIPLTGIKTTVNNANTTWTAKAIKDAYVLYANGVQIVTAVDDEGLVNKGPDYRGWAIGMTATAYSGFSGTIQQQLPNNLKSVTLGDQPFYTTNFIWQLTPLGASPVFRAEAQTSQVVHPGQQHAVYWTHVKEDWFGWLSPFYSMMDIETSNTDIVITEPGHYQINASICWDPQNTWNDHAMVAIEINGLDIARKTWNFLRGFSFVPGFSQTNTISIYEYLAAGDRVRVVAAHNANQPSWLWWDANYGDHDAQVCYIECVWDKP